MNGTAVLVAIGVLATWTFVLVWWGVSRNRFYALELKTKLLEEENEELRERLTSLRDLYGERLRDLTSSVDKMEGLWSER